MAKLVGIFYLYLIILPGTTVVDWEIWSEGLSVLCNAKEVFALHILPYCLKIMPGFEPISVTALARRSGKTLRC